MIYSVENCVANNQCSFVESVWLFCGTSRLVCCLLVRSRIEIGISMYVYTELFCGYIGLFCGTSRARLLLAGSRLEIYICMYI